MDFTKDINFNVNNLIKDQGFTLTYNGPLAQNSKDVYIHFGFDNSWKNTCHMKMEKAENGYSINIIPQNFTNLNFCFVDSNNNWDNNNGLNYSAEIHSEDEYIQTAYADTIEKTCDAVINSMYPSFLQKTENQFKAIVSYKKLPFQRYFYNINNQPNSVNETEETTEFDPTLRTIVNYKKLDFVRFFYNLNAQNNDTSFSSNYDLTTITKVNMENAKIISDIVSETRERKSYSAPIQKEDTPFEVSSILINLQKDKKSDIKVSDFIRKSSFRKFDFSNSFEKYTIKNVKNNLAINFKHNFNLSDSTKLCILGYTSFENYTCPKEVSRSFVAHFADNRFKVLGAISNKSYTLSFIPSTVPTLYNIKGFYTLPAGVYSSANVFSKVLEIGLELPKVFDSYYENTFESSFNTEMDSVAEEIINSIIDSSDIYETISNSVYSVDYSTFSKVLENAIAQKTLEKFSPALSLTADTYEEISTLNNISTIELVTEEPLEISLDEIQVIQDDPLELDPYTEMDNSYIENINQILESVILEIKEDVLDVFNTLEIQPISLSESFQEIKTSEGLLNHVSHHSLGERVKKERKVSVEEFTENIDSIINYLDSGIETYTEAIQEEIPTAEVSYSENSTASISSSILSVLTSISNEDLVFDKSFVKAEKTDSDIKEYDLISEEIKEELQPIQELQELEIEKAKLELAFEGTTLDDVEKIETSQESALTVLPISSLTEMESISKFYVIKRKVKLCLYKVFNVLPKIIKERFFGYDE